MDVDSSRVTTYDNYHKEYFMIVANKLYVAEIIERCREDSAKSSRFSYN